LDLSAPPERVWQALAEPAERMGWLNDGAEVHLRPGERGRLAWPGADPRLVRVEAVERPRYVSWRWALGEGEPPVGPGSTFVEWRLEPGRNGGTHLRLNESGFADDAARIHGVVGWLGGLGNLVALLANPDRPWEGGVRGRLRLNASVADTWSAIADPARLARWWGPLADLPLIEPGASGWLRWSGGSYRIRIEATEAPCYLAWTWTPAPGIELDAADQVLRTEWAIEARGGRGSTLWLLETGFRGEQDWAMNEEGWARDLFPRIRALAEAGRERRSAPGGADGASR
jgi:uncharacterized protein YndB with AHSA1/START domain